MAKHWSLKQPSKRELTLAHMRVAGYDNDSGTWTRLYIENKISYAVAKQAWADGVRMREAGVPRTL